jgi:hypothetical protein
VFVAAASNPGSAQLLTTRVGSAALSPDRSTLAVGTGDDLFSIAVDGGVEKAMGVKAVDVTWSPSSSILAGSTAGPTANQRGGVYVVTADGAQRQLISGDGGRVRWAPNSLGFAFAIETGPSQFDMYAAASDGNDVRLVAHAASSHCCGSRYDW